MTTLHELARLGQSVWLDYIRRSFLSSGELQKLIDLGIRGMTSNPSIFQKAISASEEYQEDLERLAREGRSAEAIYQEIVTDDIRRAADLLRPIYNETDGLDGYVSLEVNPALAADTDATLAEAKRLWAEVDRPNLMVKIPATEAGIPAIRQATAAGINVNITLIFSRARYAKVMAAYIGGLEERFQQGLPVDHIASVASFFVSRVDTKVDELLEAIIRQEGHRAELAASLRGRAGVANARMAYRQFEAVFLGESFEELRQAGARLQRPLWASTSTKNPAYSDIKYVQELIGPHTVNTIPQETLEAYLDHGQPRVTIDEDPQEVEFVLQSLSDLGISLEQVTEELEQEGVAAFAKSYDALLDAIADIRDRIQTRSGASSPHEVNTASLHTTRSDLLEMKNVNPETLEQAFREMQAHRIMERIWSQDHTVWKPEPQEIDNRLGWLYIADEMEARLPQLEALTYAVRQAGYTHAVLLGMGGSSLAPELFSRTLAAQNDPLALKLAVLDSTVPGAVLEFAEKYDPARTLIIVSTKSGTTEETLSLFKFFYNWADAALGGENVGDHFIAITDPESKLVEIARQHGFRAIFLNDPNLGGRYSALSFFGLVPASLCGVDIARLLQNARAVSRRCGPDQPLPENPAARLGVALSELARFGRDKATFVLTPEIASLGDWIEQLIAESTGKEGKGILPVVGEPLGPPAVYDADRVFIHIKLEGSGQEPAALAYLEESGYPIVELRLEDRYDLGGQFFLWELATAIAGYRMGINPFDQPDVESAKKRAREMVAAYRETGSLPTQTPILSQDGVSVYGPHVVEGLDTDWILEAGSPPEALLAFLTRAGRGDYVVLQAFLQPNENTRAALDQLRAWIRDRYRLATSIGYGPRFLHSTGQLHKGDRGNGLFIQFTADDPQDAPIPKEAGSRVSEISFGVLKLAQALGDRQALLDAGRRVLRFHLGPQAGRSLRQLVDQVISQVR